MRATRLIVCGIRLLATTACILAAAVAAAQDVVIEHVTVVSAERAPLPDATVVIHGDRVAGGAVAPWRSRRPAPCASTGTAYISLRV